MIAEELALYLQEQGHGQQNTDLFLGFQPDSPDNCVTVYDTSAPVLGDSHALSVDQLGVQILVRNTSYSEARDLIMLIHRDLVGFGGIPFVGLTIHALFIEVSPASIGRDDKGRSEWSAHYRMRVESLGDRYRT